jgi:hypothetical protein
MEKVSTAYTVDSLVHRSGGAIGRTERQRIEEIIGRLNGLVERLLNLRLRQPPETAWKKFFSLPTQQRAAIEMGWIGQADFIEGAINEEVNGFDEVNMLRYALGKLTLIAGTDIVENIEKNDILEIFDENCMQIYRSYSCFALCNYSLLELGSYPWYELYERSSVVTKQLIDYCREVIEGKRGRINLGEVMAPYSFKELLTEEQTSFEMTEKYLVRLRSPITGKSYVLSVKKVRELDFVAPVGGKVHYL